MRTNEDQKQVSLKQSWKLLKMQDPDHWNHHLGRGLDLACMNEPVGAGFRILDAGPAPNQVEQEAKTKTMDRLNSKLQSSQPEVSLNVREYQPHPSSTNMSQ